MRYKTNAEQPYSMFVEIVWREQKPCRVQHVLGVRLAQMKGTKMAKQAAAMAACSFYYFLRVFIPMLHF